MSDSSVLSRVPNAWPTIALAVACALTVPVTAAATLAGWIPVAAAAAINTIALFAAFTPLHDAAHRSVSRHRAVNEAIGRVAGIMLTAPFVAFRAVHLAHHKHANDDGRDPDMWSGRGPVWLLPVRWLTQDLYYYVWYARTWRQCPRAARVEAAATLLGIYGAIAVACAAGYAWPVVALWLAPARVAMAALAFGFDYLPHHPHNVRHSDDRFRATAVIEHGWLTPVLLYQNYHLVHHLYPGVPFYRYGRVWRARRDALIARGAVVVRLFGPRQ